jgi:hypothetical protein
MNNKIVIVVMDDDGNNLCGADNEYYELIVLKEIFSFFS